MYSARNLIDARILEVLGYVKRFTNGLRTPYERFDIPEPIKGEKCTRNWLCWPC